MFQIFETNYEDEEESEDVSNEATDGINKVLPQVKEMRQTNDLQTHGQEGQCNLNETICPQNASVIAEESINRPRGKGQNKTSKGKMLSKKSSLIRKNELIENAIEEEHICTDNNEKTPTNVMTDLSKNERLKTGNEMDGKDADNSANIEREEQADPLIENADLLTNVYEINVSGMWCILLLN